MVLFRRMSSFLMGSSRHRLPLDLRLIAIVLFSAPLMGSIARAQSGAYEVQNRIVGGSPAEISKFPSMVAILSGITVSADGNSMSYAFCGGTVIDPHWVLTAAHCVFGKNEAVAAASSFRIVEGANYLQPARHLLQVRRVVPHPQYDPHLITNDIALLELAQPTNVQPQMLISQELRDSLIRPGIKATVVGWGQTTPRPGPKEGNQIGPSKELLQATLPIVSLAQCRKAYQSPGEGDMVHDTNICAGREEGGMDSCHGDSGGPLFVQHPTKGNIEVGVVSFGPGGACAQAGKYGVYTSVGAFESFIRQYVPNASLATEASSSGGPAPGDPIGDVQPPQMPAPGETSQVNVDVLPAGTIRLGTPVIVRVSSSDAGLLMLFAKDADGHVTQLFPNRYVSTNESVLVARREIPAGATITIPGPADRFRLTAKAPIGETVVMAIVAPPDAKVADLVDRHQGLEEIEDWDAFVAKLAQRLHAASLAAAQTNGSSASRGLGVEEARPAITIAERRFTVSN